MGEPEAVSRFAQNDGVRIHYLDYTPLGDDRPPLVFVPGMTCVASDYLETLPAFRRRVLTIDLRGRGPSDTPETGYSAEHHASDIGAVLDDAGVGDYHVATFSRGTAYALPQVFANAHRVLSITMGDYFPGEMELKADGWADEFLAGRWRGTPVVSRIREHAVREIVNEAETRLYYDELAALGRPVLMVRAGQPGRHGFVFINDETVETLLRTVPGSEVATFEESSHDLFRHDRTRYARLVAGFIARRVGRDA